MMYNNEITHELRKLNQNEMNRIGHVCKAPIEFFIYANTKEPSNTAKSKLLVIAWSLVVGHWAFRHME